MNAAVRRIAAWLLAASSLAWIAGAHAAPPRLVASTAPLHSLVAGVTGDRTRAHLLVPGGRSPHTFALAPSDARALAAADAVFTAGGVAERFLQRPIAALAGDARVVRMAALDGVRLLPARGGGAWPRHSRGDRHAHESPGDGGLDATHADPHVWLDPRNAIVFTHAVADTLAELDPDHADRYRANASGQSRRLRALDARLAERLAPVADRPYLVFHDAYQYFEARYGLAAVGSVAVDPGRPPGARRLGELRDRIRRADIRCLFTEPQFEPRIARVIADGTGARVATLDPLGAGLAPGAGLYGELLGGLADSLRQCLTAGSP